MTSHLSETQINSLVDGELSSADTAMLNEHLSVCSACTSAALWHSLLRTLTSKAGDRYALPPELQQRITRQLRNEPREVRPATRTASASKWSFGASSGIAAALLLFAVMGFVFLRHSAPQQENELAELRDQHLAALSTASSPQVLSSDKHTVKPWFTGKLPFSFNLPEGLPADVTLDGANLVYLHNRPAAQLLYSIGKHRASVFLSEKTPNSTSDHTTLQAGFTMEHFVTSELDVTAVSDADPLRVSDLAARIRVVQATR